MIHISTVAATCEMPPLSMSLIAVIAILGIISLSMTLAVLCLLITVIYQWKRLKTYSAILVQAYTVNARGRTEITSTPDNETGSVDNEGYEIMSDATRTTLSRNAAYNRRITWSLTETRNISQQPAVDHGQAPSVVMSEAEIGREEVNGGEQEPNDSSAQIEWENSSYEDSDDLSYDYALVIPNRGLHENQNIEQLQINEHSSEINSAQTRSATMVTVNAVHETLVLENENAFAVRLPSTERGSRVTLVQESTQL